MKVRKSKDIQSVLLKKGFQLSKQQDSHYFYHLSIDGKKQSIFTFFSHAKKEYDKNLMGQIKKQLKFKETQKAEDFFDCTLDGKQYVEMLRENKDL